MLISGLKQTVTSNDEATLTQKREILRLQLSTETMSNEIIEYQSLTNLLAGKLKEAYDGIKRQNDAFTNLVAERDEFLWRNTT